MVICHSGEGAPVGGSCDCSGFSSTPEAMVHKKCCLKLCLRPEWETRLESALFKSIRKAKKEYRLRIGLFHCLRILEHEPRLVTLCILPVYDSQRDSLSHVQSLLVDAYCKENGIRMLKVRSPEYLLADAKHSTETDIEDEGADLDELEDADESIVLILSAATPNDLDEELKKVYDEAIQETEAPLDIRLSGR